MLVVLVMWLLLAGSALFAMLSFDTESLTDVNQKILVGKSITLEPKNWVGKQFPLDDVLDTTILPERWGQGKWIVLLHHRDCMVCEELLRDLAIQVDSFSFDHWAFIEIPDAIAVELPLPLRERAGLVCTLRRSNTWFAPSPIVLTIKNGIVIDVRIGNSAREMIFQD